MAELVKHTQNKASEATKSATFEDDRIDNARSVRRPSRVAKLERKFNQKTSA
jgi:hypothetical protein